MIRTNGSLPTHCEFCGSELVWDGVDLICSNKNCINDSKEKLKAWCLNVAPVESLGWKTIEKILINEFPVVDTVEDLMNIGTRLLDDKTGEICVKGEKGLFNQMLDKLYKPISISNFLLGLNIAGLGKKAALAIENYDKSERLINNILNHNGGFDASLSELEFAKLVQDKNLAHRFFNEDYKYFQKCFKLVTLVFKNSVEEAVIAKGDVVITGKLKVKRDDFIKAIEAEGWNVKSKVTKSTKYLITNTPDSDTAKNKEADELGIRKVTEEQFAEIRKRG